jgi:nucleoside-diphosphate-sugar epimerase
VPSVLVTGARGFVGGFVVKALSERGVSVTAVNRSRASTPSSSAARELVLEAESSDGEFERALHGVDAVIHLAAAVHDMHGRTSDAEFKLVNCDFTLRLAKAAARAGVRRFVFGSSIKVNGDAASPEAPFRESSPPSPEGAYAVSKWQAERGLAAIAAETELGVCIVRPPLVYGPGVRANFLRLMDWVRRGVPLPFGAVDNRRSLIYVENLADAFVRATLAAPSPGCRTYLTSDGEELSTAALIRGLARALGVRPRLLPLPVAALRLAATVTNRVELSQRLLGSLCVDGSAFQREFEWRPPYVVQTGLERTARWYLERR